MNGSGLSRGAPDDDDGPHDLCYPQGKPLTDGGRTTTEVTLRFDGDDIDPELVGDAVECLRRAGVRFDHGLDLNESEPVPEWELDWSLEGATVIAKDPVTDGGLDEETARRSVRPGDVVITEGGHVVRAVETHKEDGLTGVRFYADGIRELTNVAWMDVDEYHAREGDPRPSELVAEDDVFHEIDEAIEEDVAEEMNEGGDDDPDVATDGGRDHGIPDHYWVDCRFCDEKTVAFERFCRHCNADRQQHRPVEDRDPVTDGGLEEPTDAVRYYSARATRAEERKADALEELVEQQRIQNAALAELIRTIDKRAAELSGREEPTDGRTSRSVAGWIEDAALDLEERVDLDAVDRHARADR